MKGVYAELSKSDLPASLSSVSLNKASFRDVALQGTDEYESHLQSDYSEYARDVAEEVLPSPTSPLINIDRHSLHKDIRRISTFRVLGTHHQLRLGHCHRHALRLQAQSNPSKVV